MEELCCEKSGRYGSSSAITRRGFSTNTDEISSEILQVIRRAEVTLTMDIAVGEVFFPTDFVHRARSVRVCAW
jgi:hypothetical protein